MVLSTVVGRRFTLRAVLALVLALAAFGLGSPRAVHAQPVTFYLHGPVTAGTFDTNPPTNTTPYTFTTGGVSASYVWVSTTATYGQPVAPNTYVLKYWATGTGSVTTGAGFGYTDPVTGTCQVQDQWQGTLTASNGGTVNSGSQPGFSTPMGSSLCLVMTPQPQYNGQLTFEWDSVSTPTSISSLY